MARNAQEGGQAADHVSAGPTAGHDDAFHAWKRTCAIYSTYFSSLAGADTPDDVMQANAKLMAQWMEAFGKNTLGMLNLHAGIDDQKR